MEDEGLDTFDSPASRQIIKSVFIAVFAEICDNIDEVIAMMDDYMCGNLSEHMEQTLMSNMKLNPAIESLKKLFQEKKILIMIQIMFMIVVLMAERSFVSKTVRTILCLH